MITKNSGAIHLAQLAGWQAGKQNFNFLKFALHTDQILPRLIKLWHYSSSNNAFKLVAILAKACFKVVVRSVKIQKR